MGYLAGKRCYLSGAIEHDDSAYNWRIEPSKVLREEFGIDLFDPFSDPKQQWVAKLDAAQEAEDFDEMARIAKNFQRKDLCMVDRSDFLIANCIWKVPTTGTTHEIINANDAKKPVLIVCEKGKKYVPKWWFGNIPHKVMFGSWEALYLYLNEVDQGLHKDNNRWHYVYGMV